MTKWLLIGFASWLLLMPKKKGITVAQLHGITPASPLEKQLQQLVEVTKQVAKKNSAPRVLTAPGFVPNKSSALSQYRRITSAGGVYIPHRPQTTY